MARGKVMAVIGGQYGSEGKGTIVNKIADDWKIHVRVGSHNAGHSFKRFLNGEWATWKMQQIPVGWTSPDSYIVIGRGALISPETLVRELNQISKVDPTIHQRLIIDADAGVLDPHHHESEGGIEGGIHQRIGSTGEGVGAARIARLQREPFREPRYIPGSPPSMEPIAATGFRHFYDLVQQEKEYAHLEQYMRADTPGWLNMHLKNGSSVLLEGSQGVGLSIMHGPWPYVTTTDCGAAQLCADVGIPPMWLTDVLCVLRTYPIRVAGNSGPLRNEITWEQLSSVIGRDVQERTTVTKKVRRLGQWDPLLVENAVVLNAPTAFALNFVDYLDTANEGKTRYEDLSPDTRRFIDNLEDTWDIPVRFIGTGGPEWTVIDRRES